MADRETFNAVGKDYSRYVLADEALDTAQRDLKLLTIETWRMRIEAAEGK